MALYLVRQLTSSELLQRLKTIGVKHPELCKALGEPRGFLHCWVGLPTVPGGGHGSITADPICWAQGTGLVLRSLLPVGDLDLPGSGHHPGGWGALGGLWRIQKEGEPGSEPSVQRP